MAWEPPALDGLVRAGIQSVPIDLPGHGAEAGARSERDHPANAGGRASGDPAEGHSDSEAFGLEAALARIDGAVAGGRPYDLIGYSMGGRIALHAALRTPDRIGRLVLESASPGLATEEERAARRNADEKLADRIVAEGVEAFVRRWEALPLFGSQTGLPAEVRAAHRARRLANDASSLAAALRGLGTGSLPSLWERLGEVSAPTLLIVGDLDEKFVDIGRRMVDVMPDARLAIVADAGHTVHLERPARWLSLVEGHLVA